MKNKIEKFAKIIFNRFALFSMGVVFGAILQGLISPWSNFALLLAGVIYVITYPFDTKTPDDEQ